MRRISKLRLRSVDESLNRHGAVLIEDGLRTASIPDAEGARLLLVRKLSLGAICADDPPSTVALRIEQRMREAEVRAVHAGSGSAPSAGVVYFDDDLEPYSALALRIVRGEDVTAWFWRLAVRGWSPRMSRDEALRVLLAGVLASSAGPVAALQWIRCLARHEAVDVLASALRPLDGPSLLRAFGWTQPPNAACVDAPPARRATTLLERIAKPWVEAWTTEDARSLWLVCALMAVERPGLATQQVSLVAQAVAWIAAVTSNEGADSPSTQPAAAIVHRPKLVFDEAETPAKTVPGVGELAQEFVEETIAARPAVRRISERAGLFFLVQAMRRLGMERWLADHPDLAALEFPLLVLRALALRLETSDDDPAVDALGELPEATPAEMREWIRHLRRFSRLTARIGLYNLICRPGLIVFTETHIDVTFKVTEADIRVRRAGLDIDPGWMPWLGRVVHFHYVGDDAYHC